MNDPMEGVYRTDRSVTTDAMVGELFGEKARYTICSFTGDQALKRPTMWGYYANGFKGMAIEVEVPRAEIEPVKYVDRLEHIDPADPPPVRVREILCTKLSSWKHEHEYRYLNEDGSDFKRIGEIRRVCLGLPFRNAENYRDIESRFQRLNDYYEHAKVIIETANRLGIQVNEARLEGGKVHIAPPHADFPGLP